LQGQSPDTTEEPDLPQHLRVNDRFLPGKLFLLRQKLYLKAKREPGYRFYTLYEAVCRPDVLQAAWERVADNDGAPGVDGVSIEKVQNSEHGVSGFLSETSWTVRLDSAQVDRPTRRWSRSRATFSKGERMCTTRICSRTSIRSPMRS
jgi:hypothetical protein